MGATHARSAAGLQRARRVRRLVLLAVVAAAMMALIPVGAAFAAGTSSTGTLLFYPCTNCHPVTVDAAGKPSHPLPVDFKGHGIVLESHDVLGEGDKACLVCHESAETNPGMLRAVDGTQIDVKTGNIAKLCQKCHFEKYQEFVEGTHGKHMASCVAVGCHDPHTPNYIYISPLKPFFGTGIQVKAVGRDRAPFTPVMPIPVDPPTTNPTWFVVASDIGLALALLIFGGLAAPALLERLKR